MGAPSLPEDKPSDEIQKRINRFWEMKPFRVEVVQK